MDQLWEFARLLVIVGAVFLIGAGLGPASLARIAAPEGTVHGFLCHRGAAGGLYHQPAGFIPDLIPVLGQVDDILASVLAVISAIGGLLFYINNRQSLPEGEDKKKSDLFLE